ncbi:MAG: hypothetical protein GXY83_29645 [Rhodopirellula sp.]|nr:hypothetical protein [Rhodopirellula sp.]
MPRNRKPFLCCVAMGLLLFSVAGPARAATPSETLLPDTTVGFISIADIEKLVAEFDKTQLGQLMNDPVMKPFVDDLRRQIDERRSGIFDKTGLTIDEVREIAGGEVAVGLLEKGETQSQAPAVLLVDVTGKVDKAKALLDKATANLTQGGAKKAQVEAAGVQVTIFDLPDDGQGPVLQKAVFLLKDELLIASDDVEVVKGILRRLAGEQTATLAGTKPYQQVSERVRRDAGEAMPQVRWYMQPLKYFAAARTLEDPRDRPTGKTLLDTFQEEGFAAIRGAGGHVDFAVDPYQILHRTAVYAPKPFEKAMKMMGFLNAEEFTPPALIPRDVASYTTFYADLLAAFDNFGPLFDSLFGEGETGVWEDVLESLKEDPHGPQIDLRDELVSKLDNRVSLVTAYKLPITTTSERMLITIAASKEKAVTAAIRKTLQNDKEIRKREFGEYVIWESLPPAKVAVPAVRLDFPGVPGQPARGGPRGRAAQPEENPLFPNASVTVAHGHLLIASHYDYLVEILQQTDARLSLARTIEYQQVAAALEKLGAGKNTMRDFTRVDDSFRPTYELIREGRMPKSETLLGRMLNSVFEADKAGTVRKQEIEGSKMPDYEVVRRYLGPAGAFATTEEDGWFIKGMMLGK